MLGESCARGSRYIVLAYRDESSTNSIRSTQVPYTNTVHGTLGKKGYTVKTLRRTPAPEDEFEDAIKIGHSIEKYCRDELRFFE
jgi:hypothetical protein